MMCFEIVTATTMASVLGTKTATALTALDVISAVGAIAGTAGVFGQQQAQQTQFAGQAAIARRDAEIRDRQATAVIAQGETDARQKALQLKAIEGRQLVTLAGQGADVTTGTSVDLLAETQELGKLDEERIRNNAAREAASIMADASNARANAALADRAAGAINPLLAAGTTLATGIGSVGAQWYRRT